MQEELTISLSDKCLDAIKGDDYHRDTIIEDDFKRYSSKIGDTLTNYYTQDRGVADSCKITAIELDEDGIGYLDVSYNIGIYNGCSNLNVDQDADMTFDISVDLDTGIATLIGEYIPERDPDEF